MNTAAPDSINDRPIWTILLVEDEDSVRDITKHVLESAGYLVVEACGPQQALELFSRFEGSIHLLLTDLVMPTMNGAELAARLRELRPNLTTIFMSGYASSTALLHSVPGCYLQKPFTVGALLSRVAEALSLPPGALGAVPESRMPV
jgi:two-component system cell cycle sensor histidine kinase/response regulator CckA